VFPSTLRQNVSVRAYGIRKTRPRPTKSVRISPNHRNLTQCPAHSPALTSVGRLIMNGCLPGWSLSNVRCVNISSIRPNRLCVSSSTNAPAYVRVHRHVSVPCTNNDDDKSAANTHMHFGMGKGGEEGSTVVNRIRRHAEVDARPASRRDTVGALVKRSTRTSRQGCMSACRWEVQSPLGPKVASLSLHARSLHQPWKQQRGRGSMYHSGQPTMEFLSTPGRTKCRLVFEMLASVLLRSEASQLNARKQKKKRDVLRALTEQAGPIHVKP
jgi:hypothetical protein